MACSTYRTAVTTLAQAKREAGYEVLEGDEKTLVGGHLIHVQGIDVEVCRYGECDFAADFLCDHPVGDGKTCDLALCETHAHEIDVEVHLCPIHAEQRERGFGSPRPCLPKPPAAPAPPTT